VGFNQKLILQGSGGSVGIRRTTSTSGAAAQQHLM
jgi:hypothetical protein